MHAKPTIEPSRSAVPGVLPEPVYVHHDGDREDGRDGATPAANAAAPAPPSRRRNPARTMIARFVAALRGDKHMIGAYPPVWRSATDTGAVRQDHGGALAEAAQPVGGPGPHRPTPPARSHLKGPAGDDRAAALARLDADRWIDEGGMLGSEAAPCERLAPRAAH
jgi:hypothetical protein